MRIFLIIVFGIIVLFLTVVVELQLMAEFDMTEEPEAISTKHGCTVYRFYDKGDRHYFTRCESVLGEFDV